MKADQTTQQLLLQLQGIDTDLDRLQHRRSSLPESAQFDELHTQLRKIADRITAITVEVSDIDRERARAESDVDTVRQRAAKDAEMLDSGVITDPKQLQSLQSEIGSLARRQNELEEIELLIMERLEQAQHVARDLTEEQQHIQQHMSEVAVARDTLLGDIATESDALSVDRLAVAPRIPADVLALYDKLRTDHGGVGAAPLYRGRCEGCRIELTAADIDRLRQSADDELTRCEECRRILVRTPESGL